MMSSKVRPLPLPPISMTSVIVLLVLCDLVSYYHLMSAHLIRFLRHVALFFSLPHGCPFRRVAIPSVQGAGAVFKRLMQADADPRVMDSNGQNVLHHAARGGAGPRFIDEMIGAWQRSGGNQPGARHRTTGQPPPTHVKDKWGRTPLLWAVQNGHFNAVQALLAHSSDPNARDDQGETPLQVTDCVITFHHDAQRSFIHLPE